MKNKKYYKLRVFVKDINGKRSSGGHIIKAKSKKDALRIRKKFGISHPRYAKGELLIRCEKLNLEDKFKEWNLEMLERKRLGHGGSIWYEDENGKLQTETNK